MEKRKENYVMKRKITDEEEVQLYHIICDISRTCKNYFYDRKYLPSDAWSIDSVIKEISLSAKKLKSKYYVIKKNSINNN